ncbi:XH domain-containing protein [Heracleum sosnowskyi]|uniref:XH domain-containing protein n=1 Tax=Heracleum sosnowskyi TaxID=360622 RepID=A0AAD8H495_9APIA|nr:XH domain-containing protein [Heracleum sosnowskyi]
MSCASTSPRSTGGLVRGSLEAMSRTRSSGEKNDCPNALHSAQSELRGAASSILKIAEQLKEVKNDAQEQHQYHESMINALTVENCQLKEENGAAKQLLISNLPEYLIEESGIEIKLVGEIDVSPFINIYSRRQSAKLSNDTTIMKATQKCTHWQEKLKDPAWSPFKKVKEGGIEKEKVDEEDVELMKLMREMGVSVFKAVKRGLEEITEHNPSGRYPVAKLWHVKDNREARLDEIVECMMKKTTPKCKREDNATNTGASATKGMS